MQRISRVLALSVCAFALSLSFAQGASAAPLIVIDPGHGGPYSNANANGLKEKNVNLAISLELRRQLRARGYRVAMTRTTDRAVAYADRPTWNWNSYLNVWSFKPDGRRGLYNGIPKDDLQARADLANKLGADLFISIHNNGSANRAARGTETFAASRDPLGVGLSRIVHRRIVARTGLRDRRAKTADFYVCRWSNMPAILVEGAFISNPSDARRLKSYTFRRKIAIGIAEGVHSWFRSKPFKAVVPEISGANATASAVKLSQIQHPTGSPVAVIARADRWMDAPTAPTLSMRLGGPLLWSDATGLPALTAQELTRLAPEKVVLVGFPGSFDETMVSAVASASALPTSAVEVLQAPGRAELAASIAASITPVNGRQIIFADETDVTSILAAIGPAAEFNIPVILSRDGTLTTGASEFVADQAATMNTGVLFGSAALTPATLAYPPPSTTRINGVNIAAKAAAANARYYRSTTRGSQSLVVAEGGYGPGYLTAATYSAAVPTPLMPVTSRILSNDNRLWITNRRPQLGSYRVFDARAVVPALMGHMLLKADRE